MKVAVIGSGYVATVTATCLAELGHDVTCADGNPARMARLQEGQLPFYEAGLEPLLRTNLEENRLRFITDMGEAAREAEVIFICLGAVVLPNGKPDMKPLLQAVDVISAHINSSRLIVEKTTMPIKTGAWLAELFEERLPSGVRVEIAAVPHFLREGSAVRDFMHPDRIVIGAESQTAIDMLVSIYGPLNAPMLITDINSAELIKHATNAFLAMKISFINAIGQICEKTGADIVKVAKGLGLDKRISPDYLNAGVGYGGIFFSKDINSLLNIGDAHHVNLDLLKAVETVNRYQRIRLIEKLEDALDGTLDGRRDVRLKEGRHEGQWQVTLEGKTICLWGLAYRPNTDDMRDTPSLSIARGLLNRGARLRAYDPLAMAPAQKELPELACFETPYEAANGADAIVILTEWNEFQEINFRRLKAETQCRLIVDGRNLYQPARLADLGFTYICMGRPSAQPTGTIAPLCK
jgi:UDPglucose 6-dehydrogenase